MAETMVVLVSLLRKVAEAAKAFEGLEDELEGYLLANDSEFLTRLQQARDEHLSGRVCPLFELKAERCVE
jgi:CHASE3 domain sensor protein